MRLQKKRFSIPAFFWLTLGSWACVVIAGAFADAVKGKSDPIGLRQGALLVVFGSVLAAPVIGVVGGIAFARRRNDRIRSRLKSNRCITCGYSLRGNNSGVCSECGDAVPTDVERVALLGE